MGKNVVRQGLPTPEVVHGFTDTFLASSFDDRQPTPEFHKELWKLLCAPDRFVAVAAPRGHAKSTACTHSFLITCMLFRFRKYALIISDTASQAFEFLGDIKKELEENEELIELFGIQGFTVDNRDTVIVQMVGEDGITHEFRISAKGAEQSMRGTKWRNTRPDLIICDDLENDEAVENEERRAKFRNWFFNTLIPAGSRRTVVRVVGTILHFDSLLERLMPEKANEKTPDNLVVGPLKTYSLEKRGSWRSVKYKAHSEDYSEFLWPEMFSRDRLDEIRANYVDQGAPEGYAREYLNNPIASENQIFRKDDLIDYRPETTGPWRYTMMGDLAISDKDKRAYTALVVVGTNPDGVTRLVDVARFRGDTLEIIDKIFELDTTWRVEQVLLESENIAKTLGPVLDREMQTRNHYLIVEPVPCNKDKRARARPLQARVRQSMVEFDHGASWWPQLQTEMLQFPDGPFKDQVDALAHYFLFVDKITYADTFEEIEEQMYQDELEEFYTEDIGTSGRSSITGY